MVMAGLSGRVGLARRFIEKSFEESRCPSWLTARRGSGGALAVPPATTVDALARDSS